MNAVGFEIKGEKKFCTPSTRHEKRGRICAAFTLLEVFVVIVILGVLVGLLLPATRSSGEAARRMSCSYHFKQIGFAMHNYHSAFNQLPAAQGGTNRGLSPNDGNANRLSGLVALLPFVEQQELWQTISEASEFEGVTYPPMGAAPWVSAYEPWRTRVPTFECPSSPSRPAGFATTSYAFCVGDMAYELHAKNELTSSVRGVFGGQHVPTLRLILDGLSNTIAMVEVGNSIGDRRLPGDLAIRQPESIFESPVQCREVRDRKRSYLYDSESVTLATTGRGSRWCDGAAGIAAVNTILPPNQTSCVVGDNHVSDGILSAGSFHMGGCQVLMADGAVKFIVETIENSGATASVVRPSEYANTPSPYGLWGALGSARNAEEFADQWD